jgi:superfamily I DNA/RNA helicase
MEHRVPFGKALGELLASGAVSGNPAQGVREFLGLLGSFRVKFRERKESMRDLTIQLLDAIRYKSDLEKSSKTPEHFMARWGNVEAVIHALETYEANRAEPTLMGFLDDNSLSGDNPYASKEERMQNAITMMTIHSSKGLEFPFVFVVGVEEGLLPHAKNASMETVDEERRLFYVALTRGRRHVTLFEALSRTIHGRERMTTTSRFLKEIPPELLKRHVRAATDMVAERVAPPKPKPKGKPKAGGRPGTVPPRKKA